MHPSAPPTSAAAAPIVVHCHLRWDFVWQRPQHIFSRLAQHHRVLFLEDPVCGDADRLVVSQVLPQVWRVVPELSASTMAKDSDQQFGAVARLLLKALKTHPSLAGRFEHPIEWFYSPMPVRAFAGKLQPRAVVYDCMDELANFRFAPADIGLREQALLSMAQLVFTGGRHLYKLKSAQHGNTHFFGCGVNSAHFGQARSDALAVAPELAGRKSPVLGYFGVIDERIDYALIAQLAARFPEATIAMVGPYAKIDPATLPQAPNILWLGMRRYEELPALVKGFDVCLMPFALNDATRFINPTKTLEYMAAGKPIVSTAVPDVAAHFAHVVQVAQNHEDFCASVAQCALQPDAARIAKGLQLAEESGWDSTVERMRALMLKAAAPVARPQDTAAALARHAALALTALQAPTGK